MSYSGVLTAKDESVLIPVTNMDIENNSTYGIVGVLSNLTKREIEVFPNPCSEYIDIVSNFDIDMIQIFDITGRMVFEKESLTQSKIKIPTENFQPDIYLVQIRSENTNSVIKLIKK